MRVIGSTFPSPSTFSAGATWHLQGSGDVRKGENDFCTLMCVWDSRGEELQSARRPCGQERHGTGTASEGHAAGQTAAENRGSRWRRPYGEETRGHHKARRYNATFKCGVSTEPASNRWMFPCGCVCWHRGRTSHTTEVRMRSSLTNLRK